ncbi:hypothetical protein INT46_010836, partial [Mucor plumbeus]
MDDRNVEIDINAVKRTRGVSDEEIQSRRKKGKEKEDPGPSQAIINLRARQNQQRTTPEDHEELSRAIQRVREKRPLSSNRVAPPDIMKILNKPTESGVSILQYLAKDKNASRNLRENLTAMHRPKPRNGGATVIINELRNMSSSDEESYDSSDQVDQFSSNGSSSDYDSSDDDIDTVIDYPFDLKKLMNSQPVRTMVAIGGTLLIATLDTGAAISVMSRRLADTLGLEVVKVNKRFALTGFNDAISETSLVAKDVEIRVGGKLRREHFCIDNSIREKDVCLLGRTWFTNHSIKIDLKEDVIIIPTGNGKKFIEVACIKNSQQVDYDDENVSTLPVYNVSLSQDQTGELEWNQGLNTYHDDIVSVQDSEIDDKNSSTLEEVLAGVPGVVKEV